MLRLPEVEKRVALKKTRINELEKLGKFPKRRKISERACGWLESEINAFIESRPLAESLPRGDVEQPRDRGSLRGARRQQRTTP